MKIKLEDITSNKAIFDKVKGIIGEHAQFLEEIAVPLKSLVDANPEVFRRKASLRVKTIPSIVRKLNSDGISLEGLFVGISKLNDIAGVRMTIATQDQYKEIGRMKNLPPENEKTTPPENEKTLLLETALEDFGKIELKEDWGSRNVPNIRGYAADHYIIYKKGNNDIKCEIQIRTLTQDLWAVFTHYESYKLDEKIGKNREEEILNYSRLMNVSDYYAKLIRERKIHDADEFHKIKSPDENNIIRVRLLQEKLYGKSIAGFSLDKSCFIEKVDVIRLCESVKDLHTYKVYSESDLDNILNNETLIGALMEAVRKVNTERESTGKEKYGMDILKAFEILCLCKLAFKEDFNDNTISAKNQCIMQGYVDSWKVEMDTDAQLAEIYNLSKSQGEI